MTGEQQGGAKVLVTGATGFLGRHVAALLERGGWQVVRAGNRQQGPGIVRLPLEGEAELEPALAGCQAVVHLAGRAHVLNEVHPRPADVFMQVNCAGTARLASAAAAMGVRRFLFMSSIKAVSGATTGAPLTEEDTPDPEGPYGISKLAAERELAAYGQEGGMEITILRPPLVYGPGVGGRFEQLLDLCWKGVPLPLGAIDNRRSFIGVDNLAHAVRACLADERAANRTYLVADSAPLSTPALLRMIAHALGRRSMLVPVPVALLRLGGALTGRSEQIERLTSSHVLDCSRIARELGWEPAVSTQAGIAATAQWYLQRRGRPAPEAMAEAPPAQP